MNTIRTTSQGITLPQWNFTTAAAFFILALAILFGWETPAICYQLTGAFGVIFVVNGLLGMTKIGTTRLWKYISYALGLLITLFACASLYRQLSLGERGQLIGFTFYSICGSLLLIAVIGLAFLNINRRGFGSAGATHSN
jgi:hypothetical protein